MAGRTFMRPARARVLFDHVRAHRPAEVLELGTAYGASAAYMAAALEANGEGRLTTVDSAAFTFEDPTPGELLARLGLAHRVTIDRRFSTYNWYLKEEIEARTDRDGNCAPKYDLIFLDGGKNWTVEGFTAVLAEKLLRPGGWLVMDDLDWAYEHYPREQHYWVPMSMLSEAEVREPHLRAVFDLIVAQHPSFGELRLLDGAWGWARKVEREPRRLSLEVSQPFGAAVQGALRRLWHRRRRTYR